MDSLATLPPGETATTPQEEQVMNKYFGQVGTPVKKGPSSVKLLAYVLVLFILLANPYLDQLLCKVPYCSNPMMTLAAKTILFGILFMALYHYAA